VYQSDTQRTLLAEEGTNGIWPAISEFSKRAGVFYMPQSWDMGQIVLLPLRLRSGANPRTWVPESSMLTTRPPKPLRVVVTCDGLDKEGRKVSVTVQR
jgi:hypothetical protein